MFVSSGARSLDVPGNVAYMRMGTGPSGPVGRVAIPRAGNATMNPLLKQLLRRVVKSGALTIIDPDGRRHEFGDGMGPRVSVRIHDRAAERRLVLDPELAAGEAYMHGRLTLDSGSIYDLAVLMMRNMAAHPLPRWTRLPEVWRRATRRVAQFNPRPRARSNVAHHYDVDPRVYRLFLDADQQYSCAYFDTPHGRAVSDRLEAAQLAKKRHIAAKLLVDEGQSVLDIGSGWGGLGIYLADVAGARVRGITLSERQLAGANARVAANGRDADVTFALEDYRDTQGRFDRIVSVGMLEHVGQGAYRGFFGKVAGLLADDGIALIHTIGRSDDAHGITNPFIAKYIFPGGYIPALSELMEAVEKSGLVVGDVEVLRLHYADTLRAWRTRFLAHRDEVIAISGEAFFRMWEFYLAGSEASFRHQNLVVFQLQLAKRVDAVPLTRSYIAAEEERLAAREREAARTTPTATPTISPLPPGPLPERTDSRLQAENPRPVSYG